MSNFKFIQTEWPEFFKQAQEAEENAIRRPRYAGLLCRIALETGVNWIYVNDPDLEYPYDRGLASLIHDADFRADVKPSLFNEINLIRKTGNNAAHGKPVSAYQALASVKYLFRFAAHLSRFYSEADPAIPVFNEELTPTDEQRDKSVEELEKLQEKLEKKINHERKTREELEEKARENDLLKRRLEEKEKEILQRKTTREQKVGDEEVSPKLVSEADTRRLFIDVMLIEAGWDPTDKGSVEVPVNGMPLSTNPTGRGWVDYVLWGDDAKPLAVVEAKRTMESPKKGKHQAELYADCLEEMTGQRPVIYYTNGFDYWLWDDTFYPERKVSGFATKADLQLMINRRRDRKDIRLQPVNTDVVERPYQLLAIKRVMETFSHTASDGTLKGKSRKALLVMATGTGKTRTAVAMVELLTKANWAKRVLFLADRNALVTQAKNAFNEHAPHLSAIDLTKEKEDEGTRLVFSTYPTIMNKIDSTRSDDERFYGTNHFDLIIIDEAHRSVYVKYRAIFEYFDSLLIGLTATPKSEVDRNTYELFDIQDHDPTSSYELEKAVKEGFLVPPKAVEVPLKLPDQGIKYKDLTEEEKQEWEEKFGDPTSDDVPDTIGGEAINSWLFNSNTVDRVLNFLMERGQKVGGETLGKTIIFARNHKHAVFIEERFNALYPEYSGKFLRVIDNYESKAQNLLEQFCKTSKVTEPTIAVSVDMMDTGVDAPHVVNLVFFKPVRSITKFWQMIGRGTRLQPDLFGPGRDKEFFYVFDFCRNFEFFEENPEGSIGSSSVSLTEQIFSEKLELTQILAEPIHQHSDELQSLRKEYLDELHGEIRDLDRSRFVVQAEMQRVVDYEKREKWDHLTKLQVGEIREHLAPLPDVNQNGDEFAKRFDVLVLRLMIQLLRGSSGQKAKIDRIKSMSRSLLKKKNIPAVAEREELLRKIVSEDFLKEATLPDLEAVRLALRDLIQFLDKQSTPLVYTNFEDEISEGNIREVDIIPGYGESDIYREKVERFIRQNEDHLTIMKLRNNMTLTAAEIDELERILFDGAERGTKEDFVKEVGEQPLGKFIRSIVGLDSNAAQKAFGEFLKSGEMNSDQIAFIQNVIDYLTQNGTIDKSMLFDEPPFTNVHDDGAMGVFDDGQVRKVIDIVDTINGNAEAG